MATSVVTLLLLLSIAIHAFAADSWWRSDGEVRRLHNEWMVENSRSYSTPDEEERRFSIFKHNLRYIDEHNADADRGEYTFWLGLTPFTDLTNEEYRAAHLGLQIPDTEASEASGLYLPLATDNLPASVDWRTKGVVAPIKNQGNCGSCWAFSTVSTVESINKIVTGNLIILSEQQLLDCDTTSHGCDGGFVDSAFTYIIKNGGIATSKTYPYTGKQGKCQNPKEKAVSINSYMHVPAKNEQAMKKAAANQPISVLIEAAGTDFQHYKSGIFTGKCTTKLDHAVVVVGYGTQSGKDYWIVRNSWGSGWGESGYIRMQRNIKAPEGLCGIALSPTYPVKNKKLIPTLPECDFKSSSLHEEE